MANIKEIESAIEWFKEHMPPIEDYGEMVGAPPQYCGISYVYSDPCGYFFEIAIKALKEKLEREEGCEYCNVLSSSNCINSNSKKDGVTNIIKSGDEYFMQVGCANKDYIGEFKITHCPLCGRDLRQPKEG